MRTSLRLVGWATIGFLVAVSLVSFGAGLIALPAALFAAGLLIASDTELVPRTAGVVGAGLGAIASVEVVVFLGFGGGDRAQQAIQ